jgi:hypothetical protein
MLLTTNKMSYKQKQWRPPIKVKKKGGKNCSSQEKSWEAINRKGKK